MKKKKEARGILKQFRPTLDTSRHTLLFDESTNSGRTLKNLKRLFRTPGAKCKTATIYQAGLIGHKTADFSVKHETALYGEGIRIHRGYALVLRHQRGNPFEWLAYMRKIHAELREIADSVPRVSSKR